MHMTSEKESSSEEMDAVEKVQNPYCGVDWQWRSAHPRGGTSIRSRSKSIPDSAMTQRSASSPIAGQALRRPRVLQWVGQRSKATVDQRREDNCMQNGQFRTSCRSRVVYQFWKQLVGNIDIAGFAVNKSSSRAK